MEGGGKRTRTFGQHLGRRRDAIESVLNIRGNPRFDLRKTLINTAFQFSELRPYPVAEIPVAAFKAVVQRFLPISEPNSEPSLQVFHGREGRGLRLIAGDFLDLRGKPMRLLALDRGGLLEFLAGIFNAVGMILQGLDTSLGDKQPILELVSIG